jgi:hypothetical protein
MHLALCDGLNPLEEITLSQGQIEVPRANPVTGSRRESHYGTDKKEDPI